MRRRNVHVVISLTGTCSPPNLISCFCVVIETALSAAPSTKSRRRASQRSRSISVVRWTRCLSFAGEIFKAKRDIGSDGQVLLALPLSSLLWPYFIFLSSKIFWDLVKKMVGFPDLSAETSTYARPIRVSGSLP